MQVLHRLTLANLRQNRRRTLVTIIGVILSAALILAVAGMVTSFQKMMINYAKGANGDYHEMYENVPVEALKYIEENYHVESYYYSAPIAKTKENAEEYDYYQTLQHTIYPRKWYEPLAALPADAKGTYNIYVRYRDARDYQSYNQGIAQTLESATGKYINSRTNTELLGYEAGLFNDTTLATLTSMATIVIAIIVVTSVFVIRNSFSISATERMRQFGMLSSIGATPRQIRHSVIYEGLVIATIGVPLGIALGLAAVAILCLVCNYLLDGIIVAAVEFSVPPWIFPIVIILSLGTVFLSSLVPAIRAGRMPAIEAIRGSRDIKVKAKKLRTPRLIQKTCGIGGVIAYKNLKRSRKKYRTTVVSLVLSVSVFIGLTSFLHYGLDISEMQFQGTDIDYVISGGTPEILKEIQEKFNLKDSVYYLNTSTAQTQTYVMQQSKFEQFAKSLGIYETDYSHIALLNPQVMHRRDNGTVEFIKELNLKSGDKLTITVEPTGDVPASCWYADDTSSGRVMSYDQNCVEDILGQPQEVEVPIRKVIDIWPIGFDRQQYWPMLFVPENYYQRDRLSVYFDEKDRGYGYIELYAEHVDNAKEISAYIEDRSASDEKYSNLNYRDVRETMSQMRRMVLLISIFLYGFVAVVTLIGVTNIFNTITTNIALRAREFAILKSVGMTHCEFNRMIRLESLMYSLKALIIGIPLGLLLSYGFYTSVANSVDFGWIIPWGAILIAIVAVGVLVSLIMRYSVKQVERQNIIETIRDENV